MLSRTHDKHLPARQIIPVRWIHSLEVVRTALDDLVTGSQAIIDAELDDPEDNGSEIPMTADENFVCRTFARAGELRRSIAFGITVAVCLFCTIDIIGVCRTMISTHRAQCSFELNTDPSNKSCQIDRQLLLTSGNSATSRFGPQSENIPWRGPDIQLLDVFKVVSENV